MTMDTAAKQVTVYTYEKSTLLFLSKFDYINYKRQEINGVMMNHSILIGILLPMIGTAAGAVCVFFVSHQLKREVQNALTGFASGVMIAASIWSLLIPAMECKELLGPLSFVPAVTGFWAGVLFLLLLDHLIPHLHMYAEEAEGPKTGLSKTTMMLSATAMHNFPEGIAVGAAYAALTAGSPIVTFGSVFALVLGITIQNFPEGAMIAMPLHTEGKSRAKAFADTVITGLVEPAAALLMFFAAGYAGNYLSMLLSFAAGAMLCVVVEELIPEMSAGEHSNVPVILFAVGFTFMMVLDVMLG